jgi:hypothetical protein
MKRGTNQKDESEFQRKTIAVPAPSVRRMLSGTGWKKVRIASLVHGNIGDGPAVGWVAR